MSRRAGATIAAAAFAAVAACGWLGVAHSQAADARLSAPPEGYDSCHGVRGAKSEFADDEYVIYDPAQHRMEYLVEFAA